MISFDTSSTVMAGSIWSKATVWTIQSERVITVYGKTNYRLKILHNIIFMNESFPAAAACRTTHLLGFCLLPWFWSQLFKFGQWCITTKSFGSCKTSTETHQILMVSKASSAQADSTSKYPGILLRIMTSSRASNNVTFPATALTNYDVTHSLSSPYKRHGSGGLNKSIVTELGSVEF